MPKISPFEKYAEQYEEWFVENRWVYEAELRAVKAMLPVGGHGVEIGVGSGRFAEPLGIKIGVEPSKRKPFENYVFYEEGMDNDFVSVFRMFSQMGFDMKRTGGCRRRGFGRGECGRWKR